MHFNMNHNNISMSNKTKKVRNIITKKTKTELWNLFDSEIEKSDICHSPIECLYNATPTTVEDACEKCHSMLEFNDDGILVCSNNKCGIVYRNVIDQGAEWRFYGADDTHGSDPTRCGMVVNPLMMESSLSCQVQTSKHSSYGMRKIKKYAEWNSMPNDEKSLYEAMQLIQFYCTLCNLPKIITDKAIDNYVIILGKDISLRSKNRSGIIIASICQACKDVGCPRTVKEIVSCLNVDVTNSTEGYKTGIAILNCDHNHNHLDMLSNDDNDDECYMKPVDFIERYCSKLNMNQELTNLCKFICNKISKQELMVENNSPSIAVGVVYFIAQYCNTNVSKREIKQISEISEVTINKCCKKVETIVSQNNFIPTCIAMKYNKSH